MACIVTHTSRSGAPTFKVRYRIDGRSCSTTFAGLAAAEEFGQMVDQWGAARARACLTPARGPLPPPEPEDASWWLDPWGYFVYILWGSQDVFDVGPDYPIYVGQSANILNRLGDHVSDPQKRGMTRRIQVIRCEDRASMAATEVALIRKYKPALNVAGK